uniref:Extracellular globin n=1 Tax=Glossoscolex paulistus TaxID=1046353 RepID=A0A0M3KKX5_9ANNE|nr:Chain A, Globin a chain [Glossoscolex paulistus]4U8U_E Chain E, Globin a chain [Glossoscolex paulistus]4U8U_I Chain I, Globin a chain [Glossoscolex paulistus]4U8U_P Chain P, Globin a chain [Glossoscolex paulistus]4U8U_T Chain T, Globin a chain [Glossoscolex paulistus]4U8U_X Chain X, Globin a chain [Glossoscolex paulistus]4U8U_e Chain e, Globin a chain [Glossoscolex paulistus]4U8U_i Chain i, Globin a chain [Glossoscolex paulistus]4U8U_m Chain m, Globin a chain [Glossoscolex paulistus]
DDDCCSAEDRREIQHIWDTVWSSSFTDRKVAIAGAVFKDLFHHYPSAKGLFERVKVAEPDSGEYHSHLVRVANGLDLLINLFQDTQVLDKQLAHLAEQHILRKGVTQQFFKGIGESFARVFPQVSSCFNLEAWNRCFHTLADRISRDLPH